MLAGAVAAAAQAHQIPTKVVVRAISRDAKVIGDGVGGARITIRDTATGKVLAEGVQKGGTGETARIMKEPRVRGEMVFGTSGAAAFTATLPLARPTRVEITAEGPLGFPQAMQRTSKTILLVPGQHIEGDGVLLEIHGFVIELLDPAKEFVAAGTGIPVRIRLTMT